MEEKEVEFETTPSPYNTREEHSTPGDISPTSQYSPTPLEDEGYDFYAPVTSSPWRSETASEVETPSGRLGSFMVVGEEGDPNEEVDVGDTEKNDLGQSLDLIPDSPRDEQMSEEQNRDSTPIAVTETETYIAVSPRQRRNEETWETANHNNYEDEDEERDVPHDRFRGPHFIEGETELRFYSRKKRKFVVEEDDTLDPPRDWDKIESQITKEKNLNFATYMKQEAVLQELRRLLKCQRNYQLISKVKSLVEDTSLHTEAQLSIYQRAEELEKSSTMISGRFVQDTSVQTPTSEHDEQKTTRGVQTTFVIDQKRHPLIGVDIKAYHTSCMRANINVPTIRNFWRYYDLHRIQCNIMLTHIFKLQDPKAYLELADFDELWGEARDFRPILATMVAHGDLQFENSELFCVYFGNLPAYTLTFMNSFLKQLKTEAVSHPRYWPKQPNVPLERELSDSECMKAWSKRTPQAMDVFTRRVKDFHTEGILAKV